MQQQYDDEIDLFELAQELWQEKLLILLVTFLITISASIYVVVSPTIYTYTAEAALRVASLHKYGELAAVMQAEGKQGLGVASELAATGFERLRSNLGSKLVASQFVAQSEGAETFDVLIKVPLPRDRIPISSAPPEFVGEFTLSVAGKGLSDADKVLESYLAFAAKNTADELNAFLSGMGINQVVGVDMLYQLNNSSIKQSVQARPNKKLIVAVSFVVGGMLGIFVALLRNAIRKRRQITS